MVKAALWGSCTSRGSERVSLLLSDVGYQPLGYGRMAFGSTFKSKAVGQDRGSTHAFKEVTPWIL